MHVNACPANLQLLCSSMFFYTAVLLGGRYVWHHITTYHHLGGAIELPRIIRFYDSTVEHSIRAPGAIPSAMDKARGDEWYNPRMIYYDIC